MSRRPSPASMSPYSYADETMLVPRTSAYPSTTASESYVFQQPAVHGLGLLDYSMPYTTPSVVTGTDTPSTSSLPWSHSSLSESLQPSTPACPQGLSSTAYHSLSSFQMAASSTAAQHAYSLTATCRSGPSPSSNGSGSVSCRSSVSSCAPSDTLLQLNDDPCVTGRIKSEGSPDWLVGQVKVMNMRTSSLPEATLSMAGISMTPAFDEQPFGQEFGPFAERERLDRARSREMLRWASERRESVPSIRSVASKSLRTRKKRHLTTAAEAKFTCNVCGKGFGRSYNHKAHMNTHDKDREYNHRCREENCDKKFVRRTDLSRHHQSVSRSIGERVRGQKLMDEMFRCIKRDVSLNVNYAVTCLLEKILSGGKNSSSQKNFGP